MKCSRCKVKEATENWVGEGSVMDWVHGMYEMCCKGCCLKMQIEWAVKHKDDLKNLRKELKAYEETEASSQK